MLATFVVLRDSLSLVATLFHSLVGGVLSTVASQPFKKCSNSAMYTSQKDVWG